MLWMSFDFDENAQRYASFTIARLQYKENIVLLCSETMKIMWEK